MKNTKLLCIHGMFKIKTLLCMEGDELVLEETTNGFLLIGKKGYCLNTEFTLSAKEIVQNFISI